MRTKTVEFGEGGYRAVVFDEARNRIGYWFGTREQCEQVCVHNVILYPLDEHERPDPFDLACERRYD